MNEYYENSKNLDKCSNSSDLLIYEMLGDIKSEAFIM